MIGNLRKQYHFRPSPEGLLAWDVHNLVKISQHLPRERVSLSAIHELDEAYWSDKNQKPLTCRQIVEHARLIQHCDFSFPIILCSEGRVMDGMHRICKALLLGQKDIEAVRFATNPKPDYKGVKPEDLPYD